MVHDFDREVSGVDASWFDGDCRRAFELKQSPYHRWCRNRSAVNWYLRPIYTVRCIARLIARSIESDQIAPCKRDNLIARRIGQCIADRPCVLDFWSPDQCLIARLNGHRAIFC